MRGSFRCLAAASEAEIRVRGSRFIALATPIADEVEARRLLEVRSRHYFDATHNCAAWRLRDGSWRALDAGEPAGSAGAPILSAIDARELHDTQVIVTRYFGGTKLGIGGLVRAYGDAAAAALDPAPLRLGISGVRSRCRYPYTHTGAMMRALERFESEEIVHGYSGADAEATFTLAIRDLEAMRSSLREDTGGAVEIESIGHTVFYRPISN